MDGTATKPLRLVRVAAVLAAASLPGTTKADDFQQGRQMSVEAVFDRCPTGRGVATAICLDEQVKVLRVALRASVARQLADIAGIASQHPGPGMLGGASTATIWKRDFLSAQTSWEAYDARQCQNLSDYDFYGGSAAGQFKAACHIRHLVARINELAEP